MAHINSSCSHCRSGSHSEFDYPEYYIRSESSTNSISSPQPNVSEPSNEIRRIDNEQEREKTQGEREIRPKTKGKREFKPGNFQKAMANAQRRFILKPRTMRQLMKKTSDPNVKAAIRQLAAYVKTHNSDLRAAASSLSPGISCNYDCLQAYMQMPYVEEFNASYCAIAKTMLDSVCRASRLFCCEEIEGNHTEECPEWWKRTPLDQWHDYKVVKTWEISR